MKVALPPSDITSRFPALADVIISFKFRGRYFNAQQEWVKLSDFKRLGINSRLFRPGAEIRLLDQENFKALCNLIDPGIKIQGLYPLAKNGDTSAVFEGRFDSLPAPSRVICLPKDYSPRALIHEILHDVFIGGGISREQREYFCQNLFSWIKAALNNPERKEVIDFYQKAANACAQPFDLSLSQVEGTLARIGQGGRLNDAEMAFAGEGFVYAAEYYFCHSNQAEVGVLPAEILKYFEKTIRLMA